MHCIRLQRKMAEGSLTKKNFQRMVREERGNLNQRKRGRYKHHRYRHCHHNKRSNSIASHIGPFAYGARTACEAKAAKIVT